MSITAPTLPLEKLKFQEVFPIFYLLFLLTPIPVPTPMLPLFYDIL
jgi:hypothetical protein